MRSRKAYNQAKLSRTQHPCDELPLKGLSVLPHGSSFPQNTFAQRVYRSKCLQDVAPTAWLGWWWTPLWFPGLPRVSLATRRHRRVQKELGLHSGIFSRNWDAGFVLDVLACFRRIILLLSQLAVTGTPNLAGVSGDSSDSLWYQNIGVFRKSDRSERTNKPLHNGSQQWLCIWVCGMDVESKQ